MPQCTHFASPVDHLDGDLPGCRCVTERSAKNSAVAVVERHVKACVVKAKVAPVMARPHMPGSLLTGFHFHRPSYIYTFICVRVQGAF